MEIFLTYGTKILTIQIKINCFTFKQMVNIDQEDKHVVIEFSLTTG